MLHRFKSKLEGIGPGEAWVKLEVPLDVPKLFKTKARQRLKG